MINTLAPIVLFVYNRPWHTQQTIEALQKNSLAKGSELYIYSDAPKNDNAEKSVKEVREYIQTVNGFKKVTIIKRKKNWGLADSIIDGVTKIVNEYGKVIVLEDDLVTSPSFLKFMNETLELYKDKKKVWHISGYTPPIEGVENDFFIKPTSCWGWATWADRWVHFKKDSEYFLNKFDDEAIKDFNVNNTYNYYAHLVLNHEQKINTWAIFWYATSYFNSGLSLHPKQSFVENIGHDNSGTHCGDVCDFDVDLALNYENEFPLDISIKDEVVETLAKYYKSFKKPIYLRVVSKIKKIIGNKK